MIVNKDLLSTIIADMVFRLTGFGPSKSITDPYVEAVMAEAEKVGQTVELLQDAYEHRTGDD